MRAVIGLGNPGSRHRGHRHNLGWQVVSRLAAQWSAGPAAERRQAQIGVAAVGAEQVWLVRPITFMNESGVTARLLAQRDGFAPAELIVVHDDLDLPLGQVRVRAGGGSGGHRGLRSILTAVDTQEVPRVRIGIGRPPAGVDPVDYVLQDFTAEEWLDMEPAIAQAAAAVECIICEGIVPAMDRYNGPPPPAPGPTPERPRCQPDLMEAAP